MKYAIIGTGAIGGYYGGLLARLGEDVHFLLKSDYDYVKENGMIIESKNGNFTLRNINAYFRPEDMPKCDVVIIALKTTQNHVLPSILPIVLKEDGIAVILQNGLGNEEFVSKIIPKAIVIGGLCFICSEKIGPGHIKHMDYGTVLFGEFKQYGQKTENSKALEFICRKFKEIGIDADISYNLGEARWRKLVWNVPFNGLSVVLNTTTDKIINYSVTRALARELMTEVIKGAKACGYNIEEAFCDKMIRATEKMVAYQPSMKIDFEHNRTLEIEYIYLNPIEASNRKGYFMSATSAIASELQFLGQRF